MPNIFIDLHVKYPLLFSYNETWILTTDFRQIPRSQTNQPH